MASFHRFLSGNLGIYEGVDRDCPRSDPRRRLKPDGSWLPKVGEKFPGAISFWTEFGLEKYLHSGLQEWHRSVTNSPLQLLRAVSIEKPLYRDDFQVICLPEHVRCERITFDTFAHEHNAYPTVEKVVAYIVRGQEILVFEHDAQFSDAGIQVPAGTVDAGEEIAAAALREAQEECGLKDLRILRKAQEYILFRNTHKQFNRRHVFVMETRDERGSWTHQVAGRGSDQGMNFHYRWMPIAEAEACLAGSLGSSLRKLGAGVL